ncbi:hypothetical protein [Brevundimonas sp.]|uniref:hypothetical protein n=1 Tax=Brevundimonas sp. TaxID=1871086 RepID=UPI003AF59876
MVLASVGVAVLLQVAPALAQNTPTDPTLPESRVDDIVVDGRPLEVIAEEFVATLSAPPRSRGLARWSGTVCIGVVNFRNDVAHLIIDRISEVAEDLDIRLGQPGCKPNLVIAGTDDASGLAREMVRRYRRPFFRYGYTRSNRGSGALAAFQTTDAPVRWWHMSLPINTIDGSPAIRLPGQGYWVSPCAGSRRGSRTCDAITDHLTRLIIIIDIDRVAGRTVAQLADYLTLVALAQIEPDADYSAFDTVLNLFDPDLQVTGLTDWDRIYLDALYSGEDERLDPREQAARMVPALRAREGD